ncbi:MAG: hypothetical protein K9J37_02815 [Saprospiraceae bacterium]|nr:hypothetical protein [Saprospiraceae bacterium]MCF8248813.1 hypothetical protein [Saprospiraceae bacterium]MCF8279896.1 hypothetical protein [Bacteroidales bacterium]MCF8310098.1 hypothetical protein [Saprospiraceae bacterium]MCF8438998.1 hypothetical protein [Saprospiraceae bacterium]
MDKSTLIHALQELDKEVSKPCNIVMVGGAAMIVHFGAFRATMDVDVIIDPESSAMVKTAAKKVAAKLNLDEDWLNDGVKGFSHILPPDFQNYLSLLDIELDNLKIYALGLAEQLAMKIIALREQDLEDIEVLLPQVNDLQRRRLLGNMERIAQFRPDWAQKIQYFLEEQGWKTN